MPVYFKTYLTGYRVWRSIFLLGGILLLLFAAPVQAWNQKLIDAANAVSLGGENFTKKQLAIVIANNYEINLLAIRGRINKGVYQICQREFDGVSINIGKRAAFIAEVTFEVQPLDNPAKAGTDSDFITGATKVEDVKLMQRIYNDDFNAYLQKLDPDFPANTKWTVKNDIDFMADPSIYKTNSKEFAKIAKLNNAAYKRPGSARYEAFSRGNVAGPPSLQDSIDYMDEMQDMIKHRDEWMAGRKKELKLISHKIQTTDIKHKDFAGLKLKGEALSTEIFKQRALQAKYMNRIDVATKNLKKWLPADSPQIGRAHV